MRFAAKQCKHIPSLLENDLAYVFKITKNIKYLAFSNPANLRNPAGGKKMIWAKW